MRTQNEIPSIFRKLKTQLAHCIGIPLFYIAFILVYSPKTTVELISMGKPSFEFNLTILTCILFLTILIMRLTLYLFRKRIHFTSTSYIGWCIVESVVFCMFSALYIHLIQGRFESYFTVAVNCFSKFGLILIWPYLIINGLFSLKAKDEELRMPPVQDDGRLHFKDDSQKLKLVVSANSILYIEAKANYVEITYMDAEIVKRYLLRSSMKRLEPMLQAQGLVRCHRTYFINPKHVKVLSKDSRGYVCADLDTPGCPSIPVSKSYYDSLSALL